MSADGKFIPKVPKIQFYLIFWEVAYRGGVSCTLFILSLLLAITLLPFRYSLFAIRYFAIPKICLKMLNLRHENHSTVYPFNNVPGLLLKAG